MKKKTKDILIINDFAGCGRVSSQAMIPILSFYGHHTYSLPTAIVSNTLEYGLFEILDTTEYMKKAVRVWNDLGFRFENMAIGFINSHEQVDTIIGLIETNRPGFVLVDPTMAENGKLYDGMYPGVIDCSRMLAEHSTLFVPNLTEACMVSGLFTEKTGRTGLEDRELSSRDLSDIADALIDLGVKDFVITGCHLSDDERPFNLVYDHAAEETNRVYYEHIPARFIGTGDIFSGIAASEIISGSGLVSAVEKASDFISKVLSLNAETSDRYDLHFEKHLNLLNI